MLNCPLSFEGNVLANESCVVAGGIAVRDLEIGCRPHARSPGALAGHLAGRPPTQGHCLPRRTSSTAPWCPLYLPLPSASAFDSSPESSSGAGPDRRARNGSPAQGGHEREVQGDGLGQARGEHHRVLTTGPDQCVLIFQRCQGLPCLRGEESLESPWDVPGLWRVPRLGEGASGRGARFLEQAYRPVLGTVPAGAGSTLSARTSRPTAGDQPRARGVGPSALSATSEQTGCSLHPQGWSLVRTPGSRDEHVLPAPIGR
ncbi:hypothetical protein SAMN05216489_01508 [Streptomyces sp. 3213]|nr:hypothetical protein SAMN05216489_01508 [Streptomyces sp. 3213] [Streptomyces sp. 3213.3]